MNDQTNVTDKLLEVQERLNNILPREELQKINIPYWVSNKHPYAETFYRLAHYQVKLDPEMNSLPSSLRTKIIKKMMNQMNSDLKKKFDNIEAQKAKEAKNANSNKGETQAAQES